MSGVVRLLSAIPILSLLSVIAIMLLRAPIRGKLYSEGVLSGLELLKGMVAPMLMLCISIKLISACGIIDGLSALLNTFGIGDVISSEMFPLIITRPISGSASNAALSELMEKVGAESFEVFTAAVMMASSDTCFYIHSVYFSVLPQKKSGGVLALMLLVSIVSAILCLIICSLRFKGL